MGRARDLANFVSNSSGNVAFSGDVTFDTNTLSIDAANNHVGIGTATPTKPLSVNLAGGGDFIAEFQNTTDATPYGIHVKDAASGANGYPLFQVTNGAGNSTHFRVDSGTGYVIMPKIPAFNQAGYKDHTITGTGSVVMSTSNVWSTYLSNTYSSTSSGWDASTGLFTAPVAGRYSILLYLINLAVIALVIFILIYSTMVLQKHINIHHKLLIKFQYVKMLYLIWQQMILQE